MIMNIVEFYGFKLCEIYINSNIVKLSIKLKYAKITKFDLTKNFKTSTLLKHIHLKFIINII